MQCLLEAGWRVVAVARPDQHVATLTDAGIQFEPIEFYRGGAHPFRDVRSFFRLLRLYRRYRPSLVHHFHAKPLILGSAAARIVGGDRVTINTVTGLGHAFIQGGASRFLSGLGYRFLLPRGDATIFLNRDDRDLFIERRWASPERSYLVVSSGIDTRRFRPIDHQDPAKPPTVLMLARFLWQKGIGEFLEVARQVRSSHPEARFVLGGEWDPSHPDAVSKGEIERAAAAGIIEFAGYVNRVEDILPQASVFLFPSYREGVPRVLLEASASGVSTVAFDVPGCREAIRDGETGFLVPDRDAEGLVRAVERLLDDKGLRETFGRAGREWIEKCFDVRSVTQHVLEIYRSVGVPI